MSVSENIKTLKDLVDTLSWELASPVLVSHIVWFYKEFVKYVNLFEQKDLENQLISKLKIKKEALMYLISLPDRSQIAKALLNPEYQNIHVKSLLPKEGFIKDYIEYTSEHEAPTLFHLWVCVSFLGALLKRHIYYDNLYYKIFPNFFIILVAPSGICKKTTAINIGINLLRETHINCHILSEKITPEALFASMKPKLLYMDDVEGRPVKIEGGSIAYVVAPELSVFLGRQIYNEGMIAMLTSLMDCLDESSYITRGKGKMILRDIFFSLIGASTPDWLANNIPSSAFEGGFVSRGIYIYQDYRERIIPHFAQVSSHPLHKQMLKNTMQINLSKGVFRMNDASHKWWEEWYFEHVTKMPTEVFISKWRERKPDHIIKLAMVMSIAKNYGETDYILHEDDLQSAFSLLSIIERRMSKAFEFVDMSLFGRYQKEVVSHLKMNGGRMPHSSLLRKMSKKVNARDFAMIIDTLSQQGTIQSISEPIANGRLAKFYVLTSPEPSMLY